MVAQVAALAVRAASSGGIRLASLLRDGRLARLAIERPFVLDPDSVHLLHVARLYRLVLDRVPDRAGLRHHAGLMANGSTLADLASSLLAISDSAHGRREDAARTLWRRAGGRASGFEAAWRAATGLPDLVASLVRDPPAGDDGLLTTLFPDGVDPELADVGPAWAYRLWAGAIDDGLDRLARRSSVLLRLLGPRIVLTLSMGPGTTAAALDTTLAALSRQIYGRWRLVLDGAAPPGWSAPTDPRIVRDASAAIGSGRAELKGALRPGDVLAPGCLAVFALAALRRPWTFRWCCDEDRISENGRRSAPRLHRGGGLVLERNPARRDRGAERHLPAVLLHRGGTEADEGTRRGQTLPSASLVIVTRDRPALLRRCLDSIRATTGGAGDRPEIVVVDNGTVDPEALRLLDRCRDEGGIVLRRPGAFNWSALCNQGVRASSGAVAVLLNNDVECFRPDWLPRLLFACCDPSVGVVGATLLFENGQVQHNGVMVGPGPEAAHRLDGWDGSSVAPRPVSAVTGACMAFRRAVFDRLGGLEEALPVTWNDLDFCFRARELGLSVQVAADCVLRHDELGTRTPDTAPENREQLARTIAFVSRRHRRMLRRDPFLHPFLSLATRARLLDPTAANQIGGLIRRGGIATRVD